MSEKEIATFVTYIKSGGSLRIFNLKQIEQLQKYAIEMKDDRLYTYLGKFFYQG